MTNYNPDNKFCILGLIFKEQMEKWATETPSTPPPPPDPELVAEAAQIRDILARSKDRCKVLDLVNETYCTSCGVETHGDVCECTKDGWV